MRICRCGLLLMGSVMFSGCTMVPPQFARAVVAPYKPRNTFAWGSTLPIQLRRVALLPITCDEVQPDAIAGRDALEPVVLAELMKIQKFEVVKMSSELLSSKTGQASWSCEQSLPADLLDWLCKSRNCDAVLFCQLTVFRGYAPLAVGWRMRLVDTHTRTTVWAGDEIFDAGVPAVQAAARKYRNSSGQNAAGPVDDWGIDNSPRRFGQYAAAQLLRTLPGL
jgi:hypothetical protein